MPPIVEPPNSPDPLAEHPLFTKVKDLGIGSFGSVALYQRREERGEPSLCAVKFMPRSGPGVDVNLIQREIQSHRVLRHPHVIRFKQLGLAPSHMYMCMEYADQGDLLGFLRRKGPLPEGEARWLFQQIIFGLDYCHLKGVVNRDLKPENLLLKLTPEASKRHRRQQQQEREQQQKFLEQQLAAMQLAEQQRQQQGSPGGGPGSSAAPALPPPPVPGLIEHRTSNTFNLHIKIADFGLSKRAAHSLPKTRVGTINYMAPEVLLAGPTQRYDGQQADIWSAGVVLYAMLFSRVPFEVMHDQAQQQQQQQQQQHGGGGGGGGARDRAGTIQRILEGDWAVPPGMSVSSSVLHLLSQMLIPDPQRRISMPEIMEHPWFRAGLPPAALTMNTALVRQQEAQGASAGEQTEADIDELLEELRAQAEQEAAAAAAAASSSVCSRGSAADDGAEGRRGYEMRGVADGGKAPPHALYGRNGDGNGDRRAPVVPGGRPNAAAAAVDGGGGGAQRRGDGVNGQGHATVPAAAPPPPAAPAPNAFLARLACLGPEHVTSDGGNGGGAAAAAGYVPAARASHVPAASGGMGGMVGGGGLASGSSASLRAEALEAIDCMRPAPGRMG